MKIKTDKPEIRQGILLGNQDGFVMATVILLLLVLGTLIFTSTQWSANDIKRTANYTKTRDAFYTAEAGLQKAFNFFNYDAGTGMCPGAVADGFNDELPDGTTFGTEWLASTFNEVDFNDGQYTVTLTDNDDGGSTTADNDSTVVLTSVGVKKNVSATIEAVIYRPLYEANGALITEGDLTAMGSFTITGSAGTMHSNGNLQQNGNSGDTVATTATGTCNGDTCDDTPNASGRPYKPIVQLTVAEINEFKEKSTVVLRNDGLIDINDLALSVGDAGFTTSYEKKNFTLADSSVIQCWVPTADASSDCSDATNANYTFNQEYSNLDFADNNGDNPADFNWSLTGNSAPNNVSIFVEADTGNSNINGNLIVRGNLATPWTVDIITEGYLDLGGTKEISNYRDPNQDEATQNILFITGSDLKLSSNITVGSSTSSEQGAVMVSDQMEIYGDIYLRGWMVSANQLADEPFIPADRVHGSIVIEYDADVSVPWFGCKVHVLSWKEIGSGIS